MENSYRSSSVHSGVCRHGQDDLLKINEHQKWERKVTYVTLNVAWLLVADGFAWAFQNCWSAGIFPHSHPFTENGQKISSDLYFLWENTSLGSVVNASCWPEGNSNSSNRSFQRRYAEERLWLCMLKQAGFGCRRPHRLPPLSAKTGNCRLQNDDDDDSRLEKRCLVWWVLITAATFKRQCQTETIRISSSIKTLFMSLWTSTVFPSSYGASSKMRGNVTKLRSS